MDRNEHHEGRAFATHKLILVDTADRWKEKKGRLTVFRLRRLEAMIGFAVKRWV
jgi:hypothetical protein